MSAGARLRVALGPLDAAGIVEALAIGLRERGHEPVAIMWHENPFGFAADRLVDSFPARARFALTTPLRFDALHGQYGRTWMSYADMAWARAGRRTCVIQYNGSDVRTPDIADRLHPARARIVDPANAASIRRQRRLGGLVAHAAVVQDLELVDYLRESYRRIFVAPFAINVPAIESARVGAAAGIESARAGGGERAEGPLRPGGGERPLRVVHAPSNPAIKGTETISAAIDALGDEVDWRIVTGRPHHEVLAALAGADIVVDQLNAETPGVLSAEAMALGKPVLCEHEPSKLAPFARPTPVVAITESTVRQRLLELCRDPKRRAELGAAGREYALRIHAPERAAAAAERVYAAARHGRPGVWEAAPDGLSPLEEWPDR